VKNNNNNPLMTSTNLTTPTGAFNPTLRPASKVLKLGLDVHIASIVVVVQEGMLPPKPARRMSRGQLLKLVADAVARGASVACVQESCGFGFVLHRELEAAGAKSYVVTPMRLEETGRSRKTDRLDARALCLRLSRFLDGDTGQLRPIRIQSVQEQQQRALGRRREFLQQELRRLENHGRALLLEHHYQTLPARWWGPRKWNRTRTLLDPWLEPIMADLRKLLLELQGQIDALTRQLQQSVLGEHLPKGLGALTMAVLDGEVCSWDRFKNRKAPGSYTGCCPSEHSSGPTQRYGNIDRHGNARVRRQLVEAVWRLLRYQPGWHAWLKLKKRMSDSVAQKKKAVVALARQLMVDLWRWRTGRCTLEALGLVTVEAGAGIAAT
jgi:transposase